MYLEWLSEIRYQTINNHNKLTTLIEINKFKL